ncbi:MerR family transcriptional regulator [Clostridium felsineum]|uniref:HTH-type transcriptional activator mta n=1 Tax=Clostridium felsineum TaxID=36839 RepID=A0A1S8M7E8_9CLOT|nr:MerR family transcriptional regulator [Clostridium felsineum]URZ05263.1 HTH-type transcriptional activator mta [Clostridium felsineum]URZ10304.1 HTH-type transcriptional activator mta [Clostridium felsineum]
MKDKFKTVKDVAKLTGVTIRALHYYDEIDLLKPSYTSEAGYRFYSSEDIEMLQQIMFLKEIGFELKKIKDIIKSPNFDRKEALIKHKEVLKMKKKRIDKLIKLIDSNLEDNTNLSFSEFDEEDIIQKQKEYQKEVLNRFGNTKEYKEFKSRKPKSESEVIDMNKKANEIFQKIGRCKDTPPSSEKTQKLIAEWQNYITENFYKCTDETLQNLALMYKEDERFKKYINSFGDNLVDYVYTAIEYYCKNKS